MHKSKGVFLRLFELQPIAECFAYDLAHRTISVEGRIEDNGTQLTQIDFAIREDGFLIFQPGNN